MQGRWKKPLLRPISYLMREGDTFSTWGYAQRVLKHGMGGFNTDSYKASEVFYGFQSAGKDLLTRRIRMYNFQI